MTVHLKRVVRSNYRTNVTLKIYKVLRINFTIIIVRERFAYEERIPNNNNNRFDKYASQTFIGTITLTVNYLLFNFVPARVYFFVRSL